MAGKKKKPGAKIRKPVTKAAILKVGLTLADKHGVESLSMRKIAQALNIEAMSLYNHIANKDEVIDGILNLVVAEFELPDPSSPWKTAMHQRAVSAHQVLLKHPWAPMLMLNRINITPAILTWTDATVGCLHRAGFSYAMADHAWNAIDNHIYGFTLQAVNSPVRQNEYASAAEHYLPMIPETEYPHLNSLATLIISGSHSGVNDFEFGLNLLLDGLERLLDEDQS